MILASVLYICGAFGGAGIIGVGGKTVFAIAPDHGNNGFVCLLVVVFASVVLALGSDTWVRHY